MSDEHNTQPTIETLLARMNEWGESLKQELGEVRLALDSLRSAEIETRARVEQLSKGQEELRADLRSGLHRVERKLQILNDSFLTIQADNRDLEVRVEKLEAERLE